MSAYLCCSYHIGQIASYIAAHEGNYLRYVDPAFTIENDMRILRPAGIIAREFARENIASLDHLYEDSGGAAAFLGKDKNPEDLPKNVLPFQKSDRDQLSDFIIECVAHSRRLPDERTHPATWFQAFNGFEYQACEHPGWHDSLALKLVHKGRKIAGNELAGLFPDAPNGWGLTEPSRQAA